MSARRWHLAHFLHLVARFFGSLVPRRVTPTDREWVATRLEPAELALWNELPRADAVEAVAVARRADAAFSPDLADRDEFLAAALLHDVGKIDAHFGPFRRAIATAAGVVVPRAARVPWAQRRGFTRRCALYLDHAALGARRIEAEGGRARVVQWAAAHHDADAWPTADIPLDECRILARADGERVE